MVLDTVAKVAAEPPRLIMKLPPRARLRSRGGCGEHEAGRRVTGTREEAKEEEQEEGRALRM